MTDTTTATAAAGADAPAAEGETAADMWASMDAADKPAASDKPADTDSGTKETQPSTEGAAAQETSSAATTEKPADSAGADQNKPDIWETATPEQKAAWEKLQADLRAAEHENRSKRGRLRRFQTTKPAADAAGDKKDDAADTGGGFFDTDEGKAFEEDYPQVAKAIKAALTGQAKSFEKVQEVVKSITEERDAAALQDQENIVFQAHPDYPDIMGSPAFKGWYEKQPQYVREGVQRNGDMIVDGSEVADIVTKFKRDTGFKPKTQTSQGQTQSPGRSGGASPQSGQSDKRRAQLEGAESPRTGSTGMTSSDIPKDGDPAQLWKEFERRGL